MDTNESALKKKAKTGSNSRVDDSVVATIKRVHDPAMRYATGDEHDIEILEVILEIAYNALAAAICYGHQFHFGVQVIAEFVGIE